MSPATGLYCPEADCSTNAKGHSRRRALLFALSTGPPTLCRRYAQDLRSLSQWRTPTEKLNPLMVRDSIVQSRNPKPWDPRSRPSPRTYSGNKLFALRVIRGVLLDEFLLVGRNLIHDENRIR